MVSVNYTYDNSFGNRRFSLCCQSWDKPFHHRLVLEQYRSGSWPWFPLHMSWSSWTRNPTAPRDHPQLRWSAYLFLVYNQLYLRQQVASQALFSLAPELGQVFPPQLGLGAVQEWVLVLIPPPHVLEQIDQAVQDVQKPSTAKN